MICFIIWVYSANWPPYRVLKTVVSSVSPSSEPSCKYFVSANRLVRFLRRAPENKCCFWVDLSVAVLLVWDIRPLNYHMTRSALRAQSYRNHIEIDVLEPDGLTLASLEKGVWTLLARLCCKKKIIEMIKRSWTFRWISSFLFWLEKIKKFFFYCGIFFVVFPRASDTSFSSYLIWNRVFEIFNTWWSYDKFLIDSVWSGQTGNYLALGQNVWTKRIGPTRSSRT